MKLLTTIAAVLISISAFSQDYVEYDKGTFTQNGEQLSMGQIKDLTLLHKAGRGNFRRGNRFGDLHKYQNYRIANNIGSFVVGSAAGFLGVPVAHFGGLVMINSFGSGSDALGFMGIGALFFVPGAGLCAVSFKAFSRIVLSKKGCLKRRDKKFNKVADKINQAIKAANQ